MTNEDGELDFLHDLPPVEEARYWAISPQRVLAWNEYGDPEGVPVMYYHGWPSSRLQARLTHHLATERGLRLVAMDRPGMGKSTMVAGRTLDSWPELMEGFADSLGIGKFGQLGISGGGPYVFACAARIPDRLIGSAVLAGAVLLPELECGLRGLHPLYRALIPMRNLPGSLFTGLFGSAGLASRWNPTWPPLSWILASVSSDDRSLLLDYPDVWKVITRSFREGVAGTGGRGVMADADIYFQSTTLDPGAVRHPICYWHGGEDRNIPLEMVREFAGKIAGATLNVEESFGHFSLAMRKAPAALDYIAGCTPKSGS